MTKQVGTQALKRRDLLVLLGAGSVAAVSLTMLPRQSWADGAMVQEAMKKLIGDRTPQEGRIAMELPQIAENGNTVPLSIEVDSPMTEQDYCKAVHIFAEGNPRPDVATIRFSPACGRATASTRMRLAKTQNVVVVAEMSDGSVYMAKAEVKVTIGGCGG